MRCHVCGTKNRKTNNFCIKCGSPLKIDKQNESHNKDSNAVKDKQYIIWIVLSMTVILIGVVIVVSDIRIYHSETFEEMINSGEYIEARDYSIKRIKRNHGMNIEEIAEDASAAASNILRKYKDNEIDYETALNRISILNDIHEYINDECNPQPTLTEIQALQYELIALKPSEKNFAFKETIQESYDVNSEEDIFKIYTVNESIKQAELGSGLVQINECLVKEDESMTLEELIEIMHSSNEGQYLSFMYKDNEINLDGVNEPEQGIACTCYHNYYGRKFFTIYARNLTEEKVRNRDLSVIEIVPEYEAKELLFNIHYAGNINAGFMDGMGLEASEYYDKAEGLILTYDTINGYISKQTEFVEQTGDSSYNVFTLPHILKVGDEGYTYRFVYSFNTDLQTLKCTISRRRAEEKNIIQIGIVEDKAYLDRLDEKQWENIFARVAYAMEHGGYPYSEEGSTEIKGYILYKKYTKPMIAFICKGTSSTQGDHYDICTADIYIGYDGNVHIGNIGKYEHFWPNEYGGEEQAEIKAVENITGQEYNKIIFSYK